MGDRGVAAFVRLWASRLRSAPRLLRRRFQAQPPVPGAHSRTIIDMHQWAAVPSEDVKFAFKMAVRHYVAVWKITATPSSVYEERIREAEQLEAEAEAAAEAARIEAEKAANAALDANAPVQAQAKPLAEQTPKAPRAAEPHPKQNAVQVLIDHIATKWASHARKTRQSGGVRASVEGVRSAAYNMRAFVADLQNDPVVRDMATGFLTGATHRMRGVLDSFFVGYQEGKNEEIRKYVEGRIEAKKLQEEEEARRKQEQAKSAESTSGSGAAGTSTVTATSTYPGASSAGDPLSPSLHTVAPEAHLAGGHEANRQRESRNATVQLAGSSAASATATGNSSPPTAAATGSPFPSTGSTASTSTGGHHDGEARSRAETEQQHVHRLVEKDASSSRNRT